MLNLFLHLIANIKLVKYPAGLDIYRFLSLRFSRKFTASSTTRCFDWRTTQYSVNSTFFILRSRRVIRLESRRSHTCCDNVTSKFSFRTLHFYCMIDIATTVVQFNYFFYHFSLENQLNFSRFTVSSQQTWQELNSVKRNFGKNIDYFRRAIMRAMYTCVWGCGRTQPFVLTLPFKVSIGI